MRHGIVVFAFVLAAGLLLSGDLDAGTLEPPGSPAPTMKTIHQVEPRVALGGTPVVLAAPGSYYLTSDLIGVAGQVGINITSSHVTLDLNGFSLIGVPSSLDGIRATFAGTKHVVIRNGVIRNWGGNGISAGVATDVHAEDLRLDANGTSGLVVGPRSIVRNTTATGNTQNGIFADVGSTVTGCTAGSNSQSGIVLGANAAVSGSTAMSNGITGIVLSAGSMATDCTAHLNSAGYNLSPGSRVVHSVARQNSTGIIGGDAVSIEECTVEANTDDGIRTGNRGLVRGNLARGNTNDGIEASGNENRVEENESTGNGVGFAVFGTSNLLVKNSASANSNVEYLIFGAGNKIGTISTDPTTANAWANFDL